jgi:hypothetical protein
MEAVPEKCYTATWHFAGGPLDGLSITIPLSIPVPSEIVWREAHCQPFRYETRTGKTWRKCHGTRQDGSAYEGWIEIQE